ncbi:MAG: TrmH family RNA methyltransferase [Saprospiraceae bacterium]
MLSKNKIKFLQALQRKKIRTEEALFVVEGEKMVKELLTEKEFVLQEVFATERFAQENEALLANYQHSFTTVTPDQLKKISSLRTPNKALAVVQQRRIPIDWTFAQQDLCLYLADIQDPGNLGTILRIADWFGIQQLFASPETVELYNPKVIQASMGAFSRIRYEVMAFSDVQDQLQLPVYGTVLDGNNIYEQNLPSKALIVLGNEGNGIPAAIQEQLEVRLKIPAHPRSGTESLNVSIATGIVCALFRKPS